MSKAPKKKSSKANSPSWRTLLRQAEKLEAESKQGGRSNATRANLRKRAAALREQANLKHRSERKSKAKVTVRKKIVKQLTRDPVFAGMAEELNEAIYSDNAQPATLGSINRVASQAWPPNKPDLPGHGELVGGEMSRLADEIAALARKKGGKDEIQSKLTMATATARYMGEREADQRHMKNVKEIHEAHTDKIVCGLISEVELTMQSQGGLPPEHPWIMSSYVVARLLDALNRAGYTAKGKR